MTDIENNTGEAVVTEPEVNTETEIQGDKDKITFSFEGASFIAPALDEVRKSAEKVSLEPFDFQKDLSFDVMSVEALEAGEVEISAIDYDYDFSKTYPKAFAAIDKNLESYKPIDTGYGEDSTFTFKGFLSLSELIPDFSLFENETAAESAKLVSASFGSIWSKEDKSEELTEQIRALDRPESTETALEQLRAALGGQVGYFHDVEGEGQGRAYKEKRLEPLVDLLISVEDKLELEGELSAEQRPQVEQNRQLVVATAKQLFSEGALELADIPKFARLLKISEDLDPDEAIDYLAANLSDREIKILHQATLQTLNNRMDSPPPLWVMAKNGEISAQEMEAITSGEGVSDYDQFLTRVCGDKYLMSSATAFDRESRSYFEGTTSTSVRGLTTSTNSKAFTAALTPILKSKVYPQANELLLTLGSVFEDSDVPAYKEKGLEKYLKEVSQLLLAADAEREEKEERGIEQDEYDTKLRERIIEHLQYTLAQVGMQDHMLDHTLLEWCNPSNSLACYVKVDELLAVAREMREFFGGVGANEEIATPAETVIAYSAVVDELIS